MGEPFYLLIPQLGETIHPLLIHALMNALLVTSGFMQFIPNEQLQLKDIPESASRPFKWVDFAHTINGYEVMGGFTGCADLANGGRAATLTELRCSLFFEARRDRHSGGISTDVAYITELLLAIREKVAAGVLE